MNDKITEPTGCSIGGMPEQAPELKYLVVLPDNTKCMELWSWIVTSSVKLNHAKGGCFRFAVGNKLVRLMCPGGALAGERFDCAFVHPDLLASRREDQRLSEWFSVVVETKIPPKCSLQHLNNFFHALGVPVPPERWREAYSPDLITHWAPRELDAFISERVMGQPVYAHDWPCGYDPECGCYEAAMAIDQDLGDWFNERGPVYATCFAPLIVEPVPFYSARMESVWMVVEQMRTNGWSFGIWGAPSVSSVMSGTQACFARSMYPPSREWNRDDACFSATHSNAARAICRAAAKAVLNGGL